jgi:hypothetical protein
MGQFREPIVEVPKLGCLPAEVGEIACVNQDVAGRNIKLAVKVMRICQSCPLPHLIRQSSQEVDLYRFP